jgi:hypothetical protein
MRDGLSTAQACGRLLALRRACRSSPTQFDLGNVAQRLVYRRIARLAHFPRLEHEYRTCRLRAGTGNVRTGDQNPLRCRNGLRNGRRHGQSAQYDGDDPMHRGKWRLLQPGHHAADPWRKTKRSGANTSDITAMRFAAATKTRRCYNERAKTVANSSSVYTLRAQVADSPDITLIARTSHPSAVDRELARRRRPSL